MFMPCEYQNLKAYLNILEAWSLMISFTVDVGIADPKYEF